MKSLFVWLLILILGVGVAVVALSGVYDEEIENVEHSVFNRVFGE